MYVRDARGGMRPVLIDANQIPSDRYAKAGYDLAEKSLNSTRTNAKDQGGRYSPGRQGGLLVTRRNRTPELHTPSVFDTLPRGDIGGPSRFTEHRRSISHLSLPQSNLSGSISNLKTASRSSSLRRRSGGFLSDDDSPGRVEEVYRLRNRSGSSSRSKRRQRQPSGSRLHVYGSSASNSLKGSRTKLVDDTISIVSEPVTRNATRSVSRGPTPAGPASMYSSGSAMYGSRNNLIPTPDAALRHSQRSLQRNMSRSSLATGQAVFDGRRSQTPNHIYNDGRNSSLTSQAMRSSRQQLYTPIPGGDVTGVDPELKEAEKEGNQYYISMNLNAALTRPSFNGSMTNLDQIDRYSANGSRMNMANGIDAYLDDMTGYGGDVGFHKSRINVVDYDAVMPLRPSSRSVSVLQLARDGDYNSLYGSRSFMSRSVMDGYITDGAMADEGYIVKSVKATKSRPSSQMSSYIRKSYEQLNGDEKVEFDLELLGLNGGKKRNVVTGEVMNDDQTRFVPSRQEATSLNEYTWQETTARRSANQMAGPEPRFTMKLNDTLLMDYLPNEGQETYQEEWQGSEASDLQRKRGRKSQRSGSDEDDSELRQRFAELNSEKQRLQDEMELEKLRLAREKAEIEREKRRAEEELRRAEAERRRLELEKERKRLAEEEERRRQEKERERKRLEEEAEKERERRRKEEEAEKERVKQAKMQKMLDDIEKERQRLDQEREMERRRRQQELEREREREQQRQKQEEERARQRQAEEEARRKRLEQEERERQERQRQEELERERRRQQDERERERRKKEEEERERARKKREAEERERERRRREEEEKERQKRREEEEREMERKKQEEERERKRREEERKRKDAEESRKREEERRREEEARRKEMEYLRQQEEDRKRRDAAEAKQKGDKEKQRGRQLRSTIPADDELIQMNRAQTQRIPSADFDEDDFGPSLAINRVESGRDDADGPDESWVKQRAMDFSRRLPTTKETSAFVKRLMKDAPPNSVRQRVNVEREEEEMKGPLPTTTEGLLNLDTVSEKVNMTLEEGWAELTVKVRCERIVPIRGANDLYKKSSVIVSRIIDVDLTVTQERRDLYEQVMENRRDGNRLSNEDTFELYKAFMELAEAEEALGGGPPSVDQKVRIDKKVDEERFLDLQRERRAYGRPGDQDLVGLYEPGIASADFDTDDVNERRRIKLRNSSKSPVLPQRPAAGGGSRHPRTQHGKKYVRRSGAGSGTRRHVHDSDTSSLH